MLTTLSLLTLLSAVIHIVTTKQKRSPVFYITKPLTIFFLITITMAAKPWSETYRTAIAVGLVLSMIGDIFLMLPQDRFVPGLASFLLAHLLYIYAFAQDFSSVGTLGSAILVGAAGLFVFWLWKDLGVMKGPVLVYVAVISVMAVLAVSRYFTGEPSPGAGYAALGAVSFAVSDAILATARFRKNFALAQPAIMTTYYAAQALITYSILDV